MVKNSQWLFTVGEDGVAVDGTLLVQQGAAKAAI